MHTKSFHRKMSLLAWMGVEMGATAWLIRQGFAWWRANESAMAAVTIGIFVLGASGGYLVYRFQGPLGRFGAMAALLCLMAALVGGLLVITVAAGKYAALPADAYPNLLWQAPIFYLLFAVLTWIQRRQAKAEGSTDEDSPEPPHHSDS